MAGPALLDLVRQRVTAFAAALRAAGLRCGGGDVVQAVRALDALGAMRRDDCFWALHCVFVRRREDSRVFAATFHQFWRADARDGPLPSRVESVPAAGEPPPETDHRQGVEDSAAVPERTRDAVLADLDSDRKAGPDHDAASRALYSVRERLSQTDIARMSAAELAMARDAARHLARTLGLMPTRRYRSDPAGGAIDRRATLRAALRTGGDALALRRRSRRRAPRPLVVLCDVSGSMAPYASVLLHFFHALAQCHDVRTFLFGTQLSNVTRLLRTRDPHQALARAQRHARGWGGGTRIGDSVARFRRHWSRRMPASAAQVLLISDGLDLGPGEQLEREMARLARASHRIVWLNPLLKFSAYAPRAAGAAAIARHAHETRPIHNLASIEDMTAALGGRDRRGCRGGVGPGRADGGTVRSDDRLVGVMTPGGQ